jgi:hypothetical protein
MNIRTKGLRKTFFTESNSSCRQHIRQHYELYRQKCNDNDIPMNHRAIPPQVLKEIETLKKTKKKQSTLDGVVTTVSNLTQFTQEGLLDAIAKFVACDDQVSNAQHCVPFILLNLTRL